MSIRDHINDNLSPLLVIKDNKLDLHGDIMNVPEYTVYTVAEVFSQCLCKVLFSTKPIGLALLLFHVPRSVKPTDLTD